MFCVYSQLLCSKVLSVENKSTSTAFLYDRVAPRCPLALPASRASRPSCPVHGHGAFPPPRSDRAGPATPARPNLSALIPAVPNLQPSCRPDGSCVYPEIWGGGARERRKSMSSHYHCRWEAFNRKDQNLTMAAFQKAAHEHRWLLVVVAPY